MTNGMFGVVPGEKGDELVVVDPGWTSVYGTYPSESGSFVVKSELNRESKS
jgi:hypothetical protein